MVSKSPLPGRLPAYYAAGKKSNLLEQFPDICLEWNYKKNGNLRPEQCKANTIKKVWWQCDKGHSWRESIYHRCFLMLRCDTCFDDDIVSDHNRLTIRHPEFVSQWSPKNKRSAYEQNTFTLHAVFWQCDKCEYEWKCSIMARRLRRKDKECPSCKGYGDIRRRGGFDREKTGYLYIKKVMIPDSTLGCIKFGITGDLDSRMHQQSRASADMHYLIIHFEFKLGSDALHCENKIKQEFKEYLCEAERLGMYFDGCTETLPLHLLPEIIEMAELYMIEVQARELIYELMPAAS